MHFIVKHLSLNVLALAHFGMNCHVFTDTVNKAFHWLSIIMWDQSTHGQCITHSDAVKLCS